MNIEIEGRYYEHLPPFCLFKKSAVIRAANRVAVISEDKSDSGTTIDFTATFIEGMPFTKYFGGLRRELYPALFAYALLYGLDVQHCRIAEKEELLFFLPPEPLYPAIRESGDTAAKAKQSYVWKRLARRRARKISHTDLTALSERLVSDNAKTAKKIAEELKSQVEFMRKFNAEMFRSARENDTRLSVAAWEQFFRSHTDKLNLADGRVRNAFISLFAMTYLNMMPRDMFAVSSVFEATDRTSDNIKRRAGTAVYELVKQGNPAEIDAIKREMEAVAKTLPSVSGTADTGGVEGFKEDYLIRAGLRDIEHLFTLKII